MRWPRLLGNGAPYRALSVIHRLSKSLWLEGADAAERLRWPEEIEQWVRERLGDSPPDTDALCDELVGVSARWLRGSPTGSRSHVLDAARAFVRVLEEELRER